ncbi:phosphatase PAP2 family protein [Veronia pacifica]|uniref:undecaprenyl-diphosphate phosphatase n=1 Tax=Veronia pacifica TaxID=1080227 RepID=A0A1C3EQ12_9GAMM|nr:phosphatase PAP2 family protein [Veronia pacifica]ODA35338.1 Type II phosphatidic acid phosphatase [Veronia pacifica]
MRGLMAIKRVDNAVSTLFLCNRFSPSIAKLSRWVSRTGDGPMYAVLGAVAALTDGLHGQSFLVAGLLAFAIQLPIYVTLKRSFRRARPSDLPSFITPSDLYSMPSGHTAAAFLMASLLSHFYPEWEPVYWCWAAMIGISRVLLGVHFATDILAGMVLGLSCAGIILSL